MSYFYQLLISLASGACAAWIATHFALKRFYSEKWWEKRATAMIDLAEAIYHLKISYAYYCELYEFRNIGLREYPNFVELNEDQVRELKLSASRALSLISKYSNAGHLLITEGVSELLRDYLKESMKVDHAVHYEGWDSNEANEHLLEITQKLYENMLKMARKELKSD